MSKQLKDSADKMTYKKMMTDKERKSLLSILWIFVLLNMIYADILGMLRPGYLEFLDQMSQQLTGGAVLLFAVLMEVAIAMVLLSRVLAYKANRWAHFIAIPFTILWVVVPALMPSLGDSTPPSYVFFASVEVAAMLVIFWYAWKWPKPERRYDKSW
ncbi:MAG: DUF6326 family protein [Leptolyngbyaceae cyanobacterium MO_188.B28]|nr:DUF6326 family protein [Leptolyngbyaceae cyanobacterium MO_188.B28]